ncbi:unnamed protein product [Rodentolepis nana]|uniref:Ras-associating domain-containing protein n=1 Tax=Rodentolepis nana TaxID=102285 RepID=A0A0R3TWV1_RODNA|nr:unnamed protein product [Rodentolepis nana]
MFSEKHSLEVNDDYDDDDSDSSSSITIGNGTADSILKKLRKSRSQEQKSKSDKTLLDSKKGIDDAEIKPMANLTVDKHDSVDSILKNQGDNSCVHVTKGSPFKGNLYNGSGLLPASNSKLGFIEQESGEIVFTAYIQMKNARQDEYEMLKKVSHHRIRGLEKQQNCKIQFFDEALEMKAQRVYMLQITGPGYREVMTCKNSLPKCIIERLITADSSLDELFSRYQRRK